MGAALAPGQRHRDEGTIAWRKPAVDLSRIPGLPEIDREADASNARLVRAMLRTGDIEG